MSEILAKPVKFSDCHGANIVIKANGILAQGEYIKAQGQFISAAPLSRDKSFCIMFNGTGIVKFNTFPNKHQAVDWVRSKQPLPRGCRRIRLAGNFQYTVSIPDPGKCVLIETLRNSKRQFFTLDAGPKTTLAFDIECGDIDVSIVGPAASSLTLDTFCCSPHIEISGSPGVSSAKLSHYNPSSLCCLDHAPLVPGAVFILEVVNSGSSKDSGSYIRVCVAKQLSQYENNDQASFCGTSTHPCYKGRRILIPYNSTERLTVHILPEGLRTDRGRTRGLDCIKFPFIRCDQTLWFELHKVSLQVWQASDRGAIEPEQPSIMIDLDDPPPDEPAPPPPTTLPRPAVCRLRRNHAGSRVQTRRHRQPDLVGICNRGYRSETSSSDPKDSNPPTLDKYSRNASADRLSSSTCRNSVTYPKFTSMPVSMSSSSTLRRDLLCDTFVDSTPLASIGADLITLSSLESLNVVSGQQGSQYSKKSYYEKPDPFWSVDRSMSSPLSSFLKVSKNSKYPGEDSSPMKHTVDTCVLPLTASQTSFPTPNISGQSQILSATSDRSLGPGFSTVIPHCIQPKPQPSLKQVDINRNAMCQHWVEKVNDFKDTWSSLENMVTTGSQVCDCCDKHSDQSTVDFIRNESNETYDEARRDVLHQQARDSQVPTSSVWFEDTDDDDSVKHDLDIHFVYVEGKLRCHSYHSDSVNSVSDLRNNPAYSRNSPTESRNNPPYSRYSPTDSRNNTGYSKHSPTDSRNNTACSRHSPNDSRNNPAYSRNNPTDSRTISAYSRNDPTGIKTNSAYSRNSPTDSRNNPAYLGNSPTDSRNNPSYSRNSPIDSRKCSACIRNCSPDSRKCACDSRKSLPSLCPTPCLYLNDRNKFSASHETPLKNIYLDTEAASTCVKSKAGPKSIDSCGFIVDEGDIPDTHSDSSEASDDITHLKRIAQQENRCPVEANKDRNSLLPKPCRQQSSAQYCLASPLSPAPSQKQFNCSKSNLIDSNENHVQQKLIDTDDSGDNGDNEESCDDFPETSFEAQTVTNGSDKENELNEQVLDTDSGVSLRIHRSHRKVDIRNIIESEISNVPTAYVSIGPTIMFIDTEKSPNAEMPIKRSETLKRNLDTSPRPSIRKDCGCKIKSTDFERNDNEECFSAYVKGINELANK